MSELNITDYYKEANDRLTEEDRRAINTRFLLIAHLSTLQTNIAKEIEQILNNRGAYRMTIKHNHSKLVKLINDNKGSDSFYQTLDDKQMQDCSDDYDHLEELVYDWANIKVL